MSTVTDTPAQHLAPEMDIDESMTKVYKAYLHTGRDTMLMNEMERFISSSKRALQANQEGSTATGRLAEGRALVLLGESGAGKTRALSRHFLENPAFAPSENGDIPVVSVTAPSPCTLRQLGYQLLENLGYELCRELSENQVWKLVRTQLTLSGVRYVHIDEFQHLDQMNNWVEARKVRDTLKGLMQCSDWPVWIIISGLPEIEPLIKEDHQLYRRARFVRFPSLVPEQHEKHAKYALESLATKKAGLTVQCLEAKQFIPRLFHAVRHQFGTLVELVQDAIEESLWDGADSLTLKHFCRAYQGRTACAPDENVFTCENWELIGVAVEADVEKPKSRKKAGKKEKR